MKKCKVVRNDDNILDIIKKTQESQRRHSFLREYDENAKVSEGSCFAAALKGSKIFLAAHGYIDDQKVKIYEGNLNDVCSINESSTIKGADLTQNEMITLYALNWSMIRNGSFDLIYSFSSYCEDGVCIYKNQSKWEVYACSNGNVYGKLVFDNCVLACMRVIEMCCDNPSVHKDALLDFSKLLRYDYSKEELDEFIKVDVERKDVTTEDLKRYVENQDKLVNVYCRKSL